jgi:hypothetical protein
MHRIGLPRNHQACSQPPLVADHAWHPVLRAHKEFDAEIGILSASHAVTGHPTNFPVSVVAGLPVRWLLKGRSGSPNAKSRQQRLGSNSLPALTYCAIPLAHIMSSSPLQVSSTLLHHSFA